MSTPLGKKLGKAANVTLMEGYEVIEVKGIKYAECLVVKSPAGKVENLDVEGTFIEMGLIPNSQMVAGIVKLDDLGRIRVDCFARTSVPGIFAAGDVTDTFAEQVLVAVGEGAKAALSAYDYLLPNL
jgi:alkyl hydroperoxide reductase subunit AhpF